ncbi:hypothetical protein [uncultured Dysosmobacter sp.]|uniref:hypothetical protein n=1 Tax=uncultured Dysosmobacter sp. TaxID=2591384 RepID=UPI002628F513|nr:hypothetical protein [uncultured Dysosmobacter sp.]
MEPKKLESLNDIRAALNAPEVQAANREPFKKYLKANRPKSLAVVILFILAFFLMISLSSRKASSVTPVALGRADAVYVFSVSLSAEANDHALTARQREALLDLLGQLKVQRSKKNSDEFLMSRHLFFSFASNDPDGWFAMDEAGYLYKVNKCYALTGMEAAASGSS